MHMKLKINHKFKYRNMSENTAFIGLGVMGYPMAGFLA